MNEWSVAAPASEIREDYHGLVRSEVLPLIPEKAGVLLDVGGGVGATAQHLKAIGKASKIGVIDLVGAPDVDFSYAGDLERGDFIERAGIEHGPFDTILTLDILEHLVDPWAMVRRLEKVLAPGGLIVASIPNVRHYSALGPLLLLNRWAYREQGILDRTHLRFFVKKTAIEMMTPPGLKLEEIRTTTHVAPRFRLLKRMSLGLLDSFFTFQYLIRVRKPADA